MMLYLYVQQNRWLMVGILIGIVLLLLFVLGYLTLWRPRETEREAERVQIRGVRSFKVWLLSFMPWFLIMLFVIVGVYTVTHLIRAATRVPNW